MTSGVSVVIAARNPGALLAETLASVAAAGGGCRRH